MNNTPRLYIGIDPDLRVLNAALLLSEPPVSTGSLPPRLSAPCVLRPLAVFLRRNKSPYTGDRAVAAAVPVVGELVNDVVKFFIANPSLHQYPITLIVEGQSIQHALQARRQTGHKIDPDDILHLGQIAGMLMGAFGEQSGGSTHLVTAMKWKGGVPKNIQHKRLYDRLAWQYHEISGTIAPNDPLLSMVTLYSGERINAGDWLDLNDSLGLAVYGAEEGL
jgi:hypothetical protein